jgi:hypothetical protein
MGSRHIRNDLDRMSLCLTRDRYEVLCISAGVVHFLTLSTHIKDIPDSGTGYYESENDR